MSTTEQHADLDRPLRADAARNRELILQTARKCFAERGLSVTLNDIAHEAGVGVGTVYRRFADKDSLIEALLATKFDAMNAAAARAAEEIDPREALRLYLMGVFEFRARDRALADAIIRAGKARPSIVHERDRLERQVSTIIGRARDAGVVRNGFDYRDLPMLTTMIGAVADATRAQDPDAWRRYAQVVIDGVLPPADPTGPVAMAGAPLDRESLELALHSQS
ncbi:TetR/AcrR family transcriptional regulator [Curtobacterium sp. VKM Ac-2922]|uniref:TetR/AcrR family transcriptional regulator n=1 Tax=Curtobacterium sp. VKM Ac-2922 TaxID=2929475 RepID=UPI001FB38B26|nr:TetR/AcrR family transcriptional regulator [Curtobacterium sp. VKM Ac-2922]MCJ1714265.1 TetR/AcrR family transcriptional regulator [Curtobacterium sp. VKM Ac-2922]